MRNRYVTLVVLVLFPVFSFGFSKNEKAILNQGVKLYHQGNFADAKDLFNSLKNPTDASHRDSLTLFQYLGMTATQLGSDSLAIDYFSTFILVDSLFQFPSNEADGILKNFSAAQALKQSHKTVSQDSTAPTPVATSLVMTTTQEKPQSKTVLKEPKEVLEVEPAPQNQSQSLLPTHSENNSTNKISFTYGAIPLGGGWLLKEKKVRGCTLGALELAGLVISIYASEKQSDLQNDQDAIHDNAEKTSVKNWQWTQRISLSVALGTYLYSIFSATGD